MSRGAVRRFRGFFASQTRAMRVRASEPGSVLEVVTHRLARSQGDPVLRLDKDGASLEDLTSLPWQTVVVSEDGFTELGERRRGAREERRERGRGQPHRRASCANVVVWAPKDGATFFATIAAGDTVLSTRGPLGLRAVGAAGRRRPGPVTVHPLDPRPLRRRLLGHASDDVVIARGRP